MNVKKNIVFAFLLIIGLISQVKAAVLEVTNTFDSGDGSLRSQINVAASGDTVLINVKGLITLNSPINIIGKSNLTLIGPYPKHNQITATGVWVGSLFNIESSGPIRIRGIGFEGGNGSTRHVSVVDGSGDVSFEMCLFQNNTVTAIGYKGGAVFARNATVNFNSCSFINNQCDRGGAIYTENNVKLYCVNSTFSGNKGNSDAGVIRMTGGFSSLTMLYNTIVYNEGESGNEAIRTNVNTPVLFENNAVGYNGTTQQLSFGASSFSSNGGNAIRQNFAGEGGIDIGDLSIGDELSNLLDFRLRDELLEDGYGLKYWTIVNNASDLINQQAPTVNTPTSDCRRAPRSLKGPSTSLAYPDAGACEYTHLRVTNAGNDLGVNSFLWALGLVEQKDAIHYIEFDISTLPIPSIAIVTQGVVADFPYIIDGYSQPTSSVPGPPISGSSELTPAVIPITLTGEASIYNGLTVTTGSENSVIQGLRLNAFDGNGLRIITSDIHVWGCEIGINSDGMQDGNGRMGIRLGNGAYDCEIGGWEHWMRNVVTGNGIDLGVPIRCNIGLVSADNNVVSGNIIGGLQDGFSMPVFPSTTLSGVYSSGSNNIIGGKLVNSGNIIVNNRHGIYFSFLADTSKVIRNKIGVGYNGSVNLGNVGVGIVLAGTNNNYIGSTNPTLGNRIAYNRTGIALRGSVISAKQNAILGNEIFQNTYQGIDFNNNDIAVPNDGLIDSFDQNDGLDYPILDSSLNCITSNTITYYTLSVPTFENYRVEFFSNTFPDASHGEGEHYLGFAEVTVTSNPQSFAFDHGLVIPDETNLSATVTRILTTTTSEFGANTTVQPASSAEISYSDICPGDTAFVALTGTTGGVFRFSDPVPTDGATIDVLSGNVTNGIGGTTYTVIYELGHCSSADTSAFTVLPVDAGFVYDDLCYGSNGLPTSINTLGGVFSFDPIPFDGASINPSTGEITGTTTGDYTIKYTLTVDGCMQESTQTISIVTEDASFSYDNICLGTPGNPYDIATPGGIFSYFYESPFDGSSINSVSGALVDVVEGTTYNVVYTTAHCLTKDTVPVIAVNVLEDFVFEDFCPSDTSPAPVMEGAIGTFSMVDFGDGATINADGSIASPVEGTTYTVVHSLTVDGCTESAIHDVTAIAVDESFSFSPICPETSGTPFGVTTPGGIFSFDPDLGDGATLDPTTGMLLNGIEGENYGVKYVVFAAGCTDSLTVNVPVKIVQDGFSFPDFCPGTADSPVPVLEGTPGTFSFAILPDDGATINSSTGVISNPVEGNSYTVTHTKSDDGCTQDSTVSVEVITVDSDFTLEDFCASEEGGVADPELGTYSFTTPVTEGETIDPITGAITGAVEGNSYSVDRIVNEGTCVEITTKIVNAIGVDESFIFESYCPALTSPSPISATSGGVYRFAPDPEDGASINNETGVITGGKEGSTYAVEYTAILTLEDLSCAESDTVLVTVLATDEGFEFDDFCAEFTGVPSDIGEAGGTFSFAPDLADGSSIDSSTGYLTNAIPGTVYTVEYSVGVCAEKDSVTVLALASESALFTFPDHCANIPLLPEISGTAGGSFSFVIEPPDEASINSSTGEIFSPLAGGTYNVQYISSGADGYCADTSMISVVRHPFPEIITLKSDDAIYCPEEIINPLVVTDFSNTDQVYWMINTEIIDSGFSYIPDTLVVGQTTFEAQGYNSFGCYSEIKTLTYTYSDVSKMKAVEDFDICLGSSAELSAFGGVSYLWGATSALLTDPTLANQKVFSLYPQLYLVSIKDEFGCEVVDSVHVGFLPESECPIKTYNAFSPNNDGKNDFWYIDNIINFEPNKVIIYNRWGDILNEFENYDNVTVYWSGEDKNGNPLPPGTYFYVLIAEDGRQSQASWVEIVR